MSIKRFKKMEKWKKTFTSLTFQQRKRERDWEKYNLKVIEEKYNATLPWDG